METFRVETRSFNEYADITPEVNAIRGRGPGEIDPAVHEPAHGRLATGSPCVGQGGEQFAPVQAAIAELHPIDATADGSGDRRETTSIGHQA